MSPRWEAVQQDEAHGAQAQRHPGRALQWKGIVIEHFQTVPLKQVTRQGGSIFYTDLLTGELDQYIKQ